jgi:hypothetical protein
MWASHALALVGPGSISGTLIYGISRYLLHKERMKSLELGISPWGTKADIKAKSKSIKSHKS